MSHHRQSREKNRWNQKVDLRRIDQFKKQTVMWKKKEKDFLKGRVSEGKPLKRGLGKNPQEWPGFQRFREHRHTQ